MTAEMIIGSVLAAIILLRWLKWLRGDGENEEFDWLILALGVVAALTLAWRFLNPLGVHLTHQRRTGRQRTALRLPLALRNASPVNCAVL
jgi:Na+/melibiose symporter-like transporter